MDDLDDLFDLSTPEGLLFGAASGMLDDEGACGCWCGCERSVPSAGDVCRHCTRGDHLDDGTEDER